MKFDFDTSLNQAPPLENYNLFTSDLPLQDFVEKFGGGWIAEKASAFGTTLGSAEVIELGNQANKHLPVLKTHDRFGNRLDLVEYHPAYHELMKLSMENGLHSLAWKSEKEGRFVARSALVYLKHQIDEGTSCPMTMTFACVPTLRIEPKITDEWLPKVLTDEYDPRFLPASEKRAVTFGMAMTEPQGGSDVRSNISFAEKINNSGHYKVTGRKWFCSAPMSDAFLVLAQTEKGLGCFLIPRFTPDGRKNSIRFQRLKDKLGNKSNASSEVEFHEAFAQIIGEEGRGIANIMEMVRHTRLDCAVGSAATLRRALTEAIHHCSYRKAFGKLLIEQPLMRNLLADLALESEAATAFAFRIAQSFDKQSQDESEKIFARFSVAVGKYWICRRAIFAVSETLEILGGNGYVEESIMPRLYRDIPVNSIWEGSSNVQCLDVLRSMNKEPSSIEVFFNELSQVKGFNSIFDRFVKALKDEFSKSNDLEFRARKITEKMALALQAAVLLKNAPDFVSEAFCLARLDENKSLSFGSLPTEVQVEKILARSSLVKA